LDKDDLDFNQKHPTLNCENYDSILVALGFKQKLNTYSNVDNTSESKHFLNWIKTILSNKEDEFTSHLSSDFNSRLNLIVNSELMGLQKWNVSNASLIVFKVDSQKKGKIRLVGMIGSKNFYEDGNGQVNGSLAFRDAGSTLKPLLYAYGIEKGLFSINSIVNDEKKVFPDYDGSSYLPRNADLNYWGQLTLAEALANSRNIPAVEAITKISVVEFLKFLHRSGFQHLKETPHHYGPGLALGAGGASLFQLTRAYGTFVSEGILPEVELGESNRTSVTYGKQQRLFSKETAEEIKSVLSDKNLRQRAFGKRSYLDFPFPVSIKTGTSKDYRNSWAIGFNEDYIVGAWVGNFSGEKTMDVSGSFGAGRIVQNTFRFLVGKSQKTQLSFTSTEPKAICKLTGKIANSTCHSISLRVGKQKKMDTCSGHSTAENRFLSPTSGQVYLLHPGSDLSKQEIPIRIFGSVKNSKLIWNEKQSFDLPTSGEMRLPIVRGKHKLELFEENKKTSIVHFEVI
jgi:penicillin-binding protein 1C